LQDPSARLEARPLGYEYLMLGCHACVLGKPQRICGAWAAACVLGTPQRTYGV